jgi:hypothetical protein
MGLPYGLKPIIGRLTQFWNYSDKLSFYVYVKSKRVVCFLKLVKCRIEKSFVNCRYLSYIGGNRNAV